LTENKADASYWMAAQTSSQMQGHAAAQPAGQTARQASGQVSEPIAAPVSDPESDRPSSQISPQISAWTAEFTDPDTEAAYRQRNALDGIRQARYGLGLWAAFLLVFIYPDYLNLGASGAFWLLLGMRLTLVTAIFGFGWLIARYPGWLMDGRGAALLLVFGWTGFFLLFYLLPEDQVPWVIAMTMALLVGQFVFIPNLVTTGTIPAVYGVLGTLFSVCQVSEVSAEDLGALGLMLVAPAATGLFVAHRFQTDQRKAFSRLLQAEQANTELHKEIQMRRELEAQLKRQVATDPLTGLHNRRSYEMLFQRELTRKQRYGGSLSLFVLDLDHFKEINDSFGHSAGDRALRALAGLCRKQLREADIIGRLGGEEFVVMLPGTALAEAVPVAERLREKIAEMAFETPHGSFHMTATIGLAGLLNRDKDVGELVRRADEALYRGKTGGRNQVAF